MAEFSQGNRVKFTEAFGLAQQGAKGTIDDVLSGPSYNVTVDTRPDGTSQPDTPVLAVPEGKLEQA